MNSRSEFPIKCAATLIGSVDKTNGLICFLGEMAENLRKTRTDFIGLLDATNAVEDARNRLSKAVESMMDATKHLVSLSIAMYTDEG